MKLFTDYHALERVLSRISTANPPEGTVKRLSDALVQELDFTTANAWAYAKTAMTWSLRRNTDKGLPATHTVEIMFKLPADFPSGGISNVQPLPRPALWSVSRQSPNRSSISRTNDSGKRRCCADR